MFFFLLKDSTPHGPSLQPSTLVTIELALPVVPGVYFALSAYAKENEAVRMDLYATQTISFEAKV